MKIYFNLVTMCVFHPSWRTTAFLVHTPKTISFICKISSDLVHRSSLFSYLTIYFRPHFRPVTFMFKFALNNLFNVLQRLYLILFSSNCFASFLKQEVGNVNKFSAFLVPWICAFVTLHLETQNMNSFQNPRSFSSKCKRREGRLFPQLAQNSCRV